MACTWRMGCMTFLFLRPIIPRMAITPLYSAAELDAEIIQAKADLATARKALSYKLDAGGSSRQFQRDNVKALQDHLVWLQGERSAQQLGGGAQVHVGRPAR